MLIDTLNECIIDMKAVQEMETTSADTKKQATADYNFKQFVACLKQILDEIEIAVTNTDFRPSTNVMNAMKSFLGVCDKVVHAGAANNATTQYINNETKKVYAVIGQEWSEYYNRTTSSMIGLLKTVKSILPDESKVTYATNKINKAASWNTTIENYNYLKQGLDEANQILKEIELDEESPVLAFLKLVSEGNATVLNLTDEIIQWLKDRNIAERISVSIL